MQRMKRLGRVAAIKKTVASEIESLRLALAAVFLLFFSFMNVILGRENKSNVDLLPADAVCRFLSEEMFAAAFSRLLLITAPSICAPSDGWPLRHIRRVLLTSCSFNRIGTQGRRVHHLRSGQQRLPDGPAAAAAIGC